MLIFQTYNYRAEGGALAINMLVRTFWSPPSFFEAASIPLQANTVTLADTLWNE